MSPFFRGSVRPAKKHPRAWSTNPRLNPDMLSKQQEETGAGTGAAPRFSILGLPSQPTDVLLPVFNGVYLKPSGVEVVEEEAAAVGDGVHGQYQYDSQQPKQSGQQDHRQQQLQPPAIIQNGAQRSTPSTRTEAAAHSLASHKPLVAEIVIDDGEDNANANNNHGGDAETRPVPAGTAGQGEGTRTETLHVAPTNARQDMDRPALMPPTATVASSFKPAAPALQNSNHQQGTRNANQELPTSPRTPDTASWPLPAEPVGLSATSVPSSSSNDNKQEPSTATPHAAVSAPSSSEVEDESISHTTSHGFSSGAPELGALGVPQPLSSGPKQSQLHGHQISKIPENEAASASAPSSPIEPETIEGPALVKAPPVEQMSPISEDPQTGTGTGGQLFEKTMPLQPQSQSNDTTHFDEDELVGVVNHQHHHPNTSTASTISSAGTLAGNEPLMTDEQLKVGDDFRPSANIVS